MDVAGRKMVPSYTYVCSKLQSKFLTSVFILPGIHTCTSCASCQAHGKLSIERNDEIVLSSTYPIRMSVSEVDRSGADTEVIFLLLLSCLAWHCLLSSESSIAMAACARSYVNYA